VFSTYNKDGVAFAYPENWKLDEESDDEARVSLTVSSPNTAFWTLIVYAGLLDLDSVVDQTLAALKLEYPELEAFDAQELVAGSTLRGKDATFFYLDLTSTTRIRAFHRGASTFLLFAQSEDRELKQMAAVFDAMTQSLLAGLPTTEET
jgi:hypothetical protein